MDLQRNWSFVPSKTSLRYSGRVVLRRLMAGKGPASECLRAPWLEAKWMVYFMFLPDGSCSPAHLFTLEKLRKQGLPLLIVCASPTPSDIPEEIISSADALYWKSLDGFDFSGYAIALHAIAEHSPGADVAVMNDSVFGPFRSLEGDFERAKWDLTGYTADAGGENHLQSYAFILKTVTPERLGHLGRIFDRTRSWNSGLHVVICQELRFAREAARHMSVGSFVYSPSRVIDPTLSHPAELLEMDHPFLKKSLLSKHQWSGNSDFAVEYLKSAGHPDVGKLSSAA